MGKFNLELFKQLYDQGLNDVSIAGRMNVSREVVGYHRRKLGFPVNSFQPRFKVDASKLKALYEKGLSDGKIAGELGVCKHTVRTWRRKLGLPTLFGVEKRRKINLEEMKKLIEEGWTARGLARKYHVKIPSIYLAAHKIKLYFRNGRNKRFAQLWDRRRKLVLDKLKKDGYATRRELVDLLDVKESTFTQILRGIPEIREFCFWSGGGSHGKVHDTFEIYNGMSTKRILYIDQHHPKFIQCIADSLPKPPISHGLKHTIGYRLHQQGISEDVKAKIYELVGYTYRRFLKRGKRGRPSKKEFIEILEHLLPVDVLKEGES